VLTLDLFKRPDLRVLCIGAHSDDIEIGCGGTLLKMLGENSSVSVHWAVFSANPERAKEARASAAEFLVGSREQSLDVFDFRESFMPWNGSAIKERFETLKAHRPDVVFTHFRRDLHQDHRLLGELTWNTFRNHVVLEYEVVKYEGDLVTPNAYVALPEDVCARKVALLRKHFGSQWSKHWFDEELFRSLLRIRGVECASPTRFAEAFHAPKLSL
jgi:LmbE family N-acetylglucosaminyl deacetylase